MSRPDEYPQNPTDRDIERLLAAESDIDTTPPADLLARVVDEIPDDLGATVFGASDDPSGEAEETTDRPASISAAIPGGGPGRTWALAAMLVLVAGAAFLWPRVMNQQDAASSGDRPDSAHLRAIGILDGTEEPRAESPPKTEISEMEAAGVRERVSDLSKRRDDYRAQLEAIQAQRATQDRRAESPSPPPPPPAPPAPPPPTRLAPPPAAEPTPEGADRSIELGTRARVSDGRAVAERQEKVTFEDETTVVAPRPVLVEPKSMSQGVMIEPTIAQHLARANPNDAPYDAMYFESAGTNPFVGTEDDALSTFGLDVDTGSWGVVKRYLRDGHLPPPDAVRVEEILNAFDYGDAPPEDGSDFAVHLEAAPALHAENERAILLRIAVQGREIDAAARAAATLVFVVDVSGSMDRENRLGLVKRSLGLLLDQLREEDRVGLVTYGSTARVVLEPTGDVERVRAALQALVPDGSTNAEEGLRLGYELAAKHRREGAIQRVILCSDGVANTGATGSDEILRRVRRHADQGVELTTVGFGMGNYNDVLMERLADDGNGRYAYVDALPEAHRLFVEELTGTLQTIAAEARAQVVFDPEHVERWRLLGYENRDIADERFRDDTVDAGEIGAGHTVTVLYELKLAEKRPPRRAQLAEVRLRWASIAAGEMVETSTVLRGREVKRDVEDASSAFRLAANVAEFAEILRRSYWARESDPKAVATALQRLAAERPGDAELAELASLAVRAAARMEERSTER